MGFLLFFVDGLGWNENPRTNPILKGNYPHLEKLVAGPEEGRLLIADASLNCSGLPQSATGQTALFTGVNPIPRVGGHRSGFPGPTLIDIIKEHSLLKKIDDRGLKSTFANAYTHNFTWENIRWASVTTYMVLAAGQKFRNLDDLRRGQAVYQEFTNQDLRERGFEVPLFSPLQAADNLLNIVTLNDLTIYEFFQTDIAGHRNDREFSYQVLKNLDQFLGRLIAGLPPDLTLIISSDHGNVEDDTTPLHTLNPVPVLALGPAAAAFDEVQKITDIAPIIQELM